MKRVVTSVSIPFNVYKFYNDQGKHLSKVLIEKYQYDCGNLLVSALEELQKAKDNVLQMELKVLQLQSNCSTNSAKCSTIFEAFRKERDINNPTSQDRHWIKCRLEANQINEVSVEQFILTFQNKKEDK